jgi:chitin disaccharide deacetylase
VKTLIVTADDFGAAMEVNEAVEQGHKHGILTAASLMVTGAAAADAVARAKAMPTLGVGLHLVLVEGRPMLHPSQVPDLVDDAGLFRTDMARMGLDIFFRPAVRRQVYAEVEAQFAAFAATGLPLDHVNAHKHFHLHPVIASAMLHSGAKYGMRAARAPVEPGAGGIEQPWAKLLRRRLRKAGADVPDQVYGVTWSGAMTPARVADIVSSLPEGLSELYLHPATSNNFAEHTPGYLHAEELAALTDPAVRAILDAAGIRLARFADLRAA